jgi:uncharacterized membrane protein YphA (DoxX/SURF4 family)
MPVLKLISVGLPVALGLVMVGHGGVTFAGPTSVRENFARWGYPAGFYVVTVVLEMLVGLLLLIPVTSRVGGFGSAIVVLSAIAMQIRGGDWENLPAALALMAASVAAIVIHR